MIQPINRDQQFLSQASAPATMDDLQVAQDLVDTLTAHENECVGMAANMIGVHKQIIAVCIGPLKLAMLNPQIINKQSPYQTKEGCLSLTGLRPTTRFKKITVRYQNLQGKVQVLPLEGFAAQIVQHELDHCQGILI